MLQGGMRPNASTLVGIVGMCGSAGDRGVGDSLHAFALKGGAIDVWSSISHGNTSLPCLAV
jgi:hypothetical protein